MKFKVQGFSKFAPRFSRRKRQEAFRRETAEIAAIQVVLREGKLIALKGWEERLPGDVTTSL